MLRIQWIRGGPGSLLLTLALPLGAQMLGAQLAGAQAISGPATAGSTSAADATPMAPVAAMAPTAASNGAVERVPLTLAEAESEALRGNRDLEAAEARRDAVDARARGSEAFLWPGLQANAGVLRTTDPVGVFGTKLRQERFTEMDFALPGLNQPDAVNDWTAGVGASWQIASPSRWFERGAARAGVDAAGFGVQRTEEAVVFQTRVLYLRAIQAAGTLQAAGVALEAAQATAERVSRRVDEGMATEADRLQARAAASQAEAQVELAQAAVADAGDALGAHLGWGPERVPEPAETEPDFELATRARDDDPSSAGLLERADLRASALGVQAVEAQARAVGAARLPSIEAFGQASAHTPAFDDATGTNWTVGVQLSLPIFTGFGLAAQHDAARAEARAAGAEHAQRVQQATVEVRAARRGLDAAQQALTAVEAAQQAATEAVRLLRRRHEEGMTTLADLLQAEARAAQLDARLVEARTGVLMARAYLDFAWGDVR